MMSDDLRRSYLIRAQSLEDSLRRLLSEIFQHLPPEGRRQFREALGDRVDLLFSGIEDAVLFDPDNDVWMREHRISNVHELSNQLIAAQAALERERRKAARESDDLDIEARKLRNQHVRDELDAEAGS